MKKIEIAFKNLYLKSKEIGDGLSSDQQDLILEKVVDEKILEALIKQNEGAFSENEKNKIYNDLKKHMTKWKTKMDLEKGK